MAGTIRSSWINFWHLTQSGEQIMDMNAVLQEIDSWPVADQIRLVE